MLAPLRAIVLLASSATLFAQTPAGDYPQPDAFDLVLRGGTLVDGAARTATRGDLGIRAGRIAAIGEVAFLPGTPVVDIDGLHVAPGFIDLHAHVDSDVGRVPLCQNFLRMGVTTLITGNCGSSVTDLAAHFARIDKGGIGLNYGSLVGHGTVRTAVLGTANRAPLAGELQRMQELVATGMQAGAFGMSTGLIYVPGTYAQREELAALATVVGQHGGVYASHMRQEGDQILDSIAEALFIGEHGKCAVHISHIKCTGKQNHGRADEVLKVLQEARTRGVRVSADQYAYDASSTGLDVLFPSEALAVGREEFGKRLAGDKPFRSEMHAALLKKMDQVGFSDFRYARIASAKGNEDLNGLLLPEAAQRRLHRSDRSAQAEIAMDLLIAAVPVRVSMIYHTMGEADVERFMAEDWIAVASDAGIRAEAGVERPHPRGSGNNPRVLGHYVRERQVTDLPTAIHKMTSLPARLFGIKDRGELRVSAFADLVVFDAAAILDKATFQEPTLPPVGITMVLVNGQIAVHHDKVTGVKAGMVLRRNAGQKR